MFQRISNLLFGEVEEVESELNPCVTDADEEGWLLVNLPEGATAEASPMEDLLIEHPSMSVYVSPGSGATLVEDSMTSVSRVTEAATPSMVRSAVSTRGSCGAAAQVGALAKVTQVSRVQRAKARAERRLLGRNHIQRQNRVREKAPHHGGHARIALLHQPGQRNFHH